MQPPKLVLNVPLDWNLGEVEDQFMIGWSFFSPTTVGIFTLLGYLAQTFSLRLLGWW